MQEQKKHLIFSDIDGTLLDSMHRMPRGVAAAARRAEQKGIPFILISARMPKSIREIRAEMGLCSPYVAYSGALALDGTGTVLFEERIQADAAEAICEAARRNFPNVCVSVYGGDRWITTEPENLWAVEEASITGLTVEGACTWREACREIPIHKIFCMGMPAAVARLREVVLARFPACNAYLSKDTYLEIIPASVSKAAALRTMCDHYGAKPEDAFAFGDYYNDIDMLRAAGTGVAMGNAPDAVKAAADAVTDSNNREGVRIFLERSGLL